ncbi:MAG TPA: hypothetical protein VJN64_01310 [Terriglobales bacterium]|nr:hypothetical protein [Terriglobales bacterium]
MRRMSLSLLMAGAAWSLLIAASARAQTGASFTAINVPGANATGARGVNIHGEIVGWFKTSATCSAIDLGVPTCLGPGGSFQFPFHGFTLLNKRFIRFDFPGASGTAILGVNDPGDFVGVYVKANRMHGFLRLHTGVLKTLDIAPPPLLPNGTSTAPIGVNKFGTVVGSLWSVFGEGPFGGFRWFNGHFATANFPGFTDDGVFGNSNTGLLALEVFDHDFWTTGLLNGKDADILPSPAMTDTFVTGVNSGGDIVGRFEGLGFFAPHVEANEGTTDKEVVPKYLSLKFPGAVTTVPDGISDNRIIVGSYQASNKLHGFMAVLH